MIIIHCDLPLPWDQAHGLAKPEEWRQDNEAYAIRTPSQSRDSSLQECAQIQLLHFRPVSGELDRATHMHQWTTETHILRRKKMCASYIPEHRYWYVTSAARSLPDVFEYQLP